jgi:hypothetical protein
MSPKSSIGTRKYDGRFRIVFDDLRKLMASPEKPRKRTRFNIHD